MLESLLNCEIQHGVLGFTTLCVLLKVKYLKRYLHLKIKHFISIFGMCSHFYDAADF